MASRWTDSGINWGNITQESDRLSFVVDELFLAYSEKRALVSFYRQVNSSVDVWDTAPTKERIVNKVDEIIKGLKYILSDGNQTTPVTITDRYCYIDTYIDISMSTANSDQKLRGMQAFTLDVGGGLELTAGDLSRLRDWNPVNSRIDADLLNLIYRVLLALDTVGNEYVTTVFGTPKYFESISNSLVWGSSDLDYATALSDYNSSLSNSQKLDASVISVAHNNPEYNFVHHNAIHGFGGNARNSSNNIVTSFTFDIYLFNNIPNSSPGFDYIQLPGFNYFEFTKQTGSASTPLSIQSHPYSPWPVPAVDELHYKSVWAIHALKLDITMVEYYTP